MNRWLGRGDGLDSTCLLASLRCPVRYRNWVPFDPHAPRSSAHRAPGMSAGGKFWGQNGKGDQAGMPSRLSQTG